MSYQQDPSILQAIAEWLRSQANRPDQEPGNLVRPRGHSMGFSQAQAEEGYARDAAAAQQQYGMFNDGSPNALQGGVVNQPPHGLEVYPNPDYAVQHGATGSWEPRGYRAEQEPDGFLESLRGAVDREVGNAVQFADHHIGNALQTRIPGTGALAPEDGMADLPAKGATVDFRVSGAKKSKSEFGDFFKLLKKAKGGDEKTKSKISELAKQLDDEELSASGGAVPVT